jgi:hypothetical protein
MWIFIASLLFIVLGITMESLLLVQDPSSYALMGLACGVLATVGWWK